jgi:hypothetical protein
VFSDDKKRDSFFTLLLRIKTFTITAKAQTMGGVVRMQTRQTDDMSYISEEDGSTGGDGGGGGGRGRPVAGLLDADSSDDEQ